MNDEEIKKAYKDYVDDMIEYENEIVDNMESFPEITNDIYVIRNTKSNTTKAYIKKVKSNAKIPKRAPPLSLSPPPENISENDK